ncbi:MAG: GntR family transcriptional regulator [Planctomycetes bacterium]|nr:GntR family transcriptional regulator [Planctomycetota bacterium]
MNSRLIEEPPVPLYYKVKNDLKQKILNGVYKEGDLLPTEREICELYEVSRITVVKSLTELVNEGWINRRQGKGSFAAKPPEREAIASNIGFVTDKLELIAHPFFTGLVSAIKSELLEKDVGLLISTLEDGLWHTKLIKNKRVNGIISMTPQLNSQDIIELKHNREIPLVLLFNDRRDKDSISVNIDWKKGMSIAIQYLLKLGHTRIAFLQGNSAYAPDQEKLEGYRETLKDAGIEPDDSLIIETLYEKERVPELIQVFLDVLVPPTAFVCADDVLAEKTMRVLKEMGKNIPDDFSIIGFNDMEVASMVSPTLTTVRIPLEEVGRLSTQMLLKLMHGEAIVERQPLLQPELIIRESCGGDCKEYA